ncbi:MAG: hypothetical protein ACREFY_12050 [Acetobacteraceae bacterium]
MSNTWRLRRRLLPWAADCLGVVGLDVAPAPTVPCSLLGTIAIPASTTGGTLTTFDTSTHDYDLADRSDSAVDALSVATNSFVTQVDADTFSGVQSSSDTSGPNGALVENNAGVDQL